MGLWSKHDKNQQNDVDFLMADNAEIITTTSDAMKQWAVNFWKISEKNIHIVPYPYIPNPKYLEIKSETDNKRVLFIGKLNVHKGLVKLTEAIPKVLTKHKDIKFRFVAADGPSHIKGTKMQKYMLNKLDKYKNSLEFTNNVPLHEIPNHIAISDFCIFPSIWECFGLVVCECMSAGKTPIVSNNGGMIEIIEEGKTGISVNPQSSSDIAQKIIYLIENKEKRDKMGLEGRKSILKKYNSEIIGNLMEKVYKSVIK